MLFLEYDIIVDDQPLVNTVKLRHTSEESIAKEFNSIQKGSKMER